MSDHPAEESTPKWTFLNATERRLVGVLVEKAKTTPNTYPLTLNAIITGSNQKNNRYPLTELNEDRVEDALETLRQKGAVMLVDGAGRVQKYRHRLYDWLGVDKTELAVMAELLLRGTQTEGELRGRAARMEPIKDVGELRPILDSLAAKNLIVRWGRMVTHNLYSPQELERQKQQYASGADDGGNEESSASAFREAPVSHTPVAPVSHASAPGAASTFSAPAAAAPSSADSTKTAKLLQEVESLKSQVEKLTDENEVLSHLVDELQKAVEDIRRELGMI